LPVNSTRGGFITKLNTSGSALVYSTYLAGSTTDKLRGLAVDSGGNAYVMAARSPLIFRLRQTHSKKPWQELQTLFVSKMNPAARSGYSTFIGGMVRCGNSSPLMLRGMPTSPGAQYLPTFPRRIRFKAAFAGGGTTVPRQPCVDLRRCVLSLKLDPTGSELDIFFLHSAAVARIPA